MGKISESQVKAIKQLVFNCINSMDAYNKAKLHSDITKAHIRIHQSKKDFDEYLDSITEK